MSRWILRAAAAVALSLWAASAAQAQPMNWLALCSKCLKPIITTSSGLGTANAMAEAKITRAEIVGWCENWSPGDKRCVAAELANPDNKQTYRASADCTKGRITPVDGKTYTYAGVWSNDDIGGGRSKWRDAAGQIVGRDNASGGLGISQQWEVLCPRGLVSASASARPGPGPGPGPGPAPGTRPGVGVTSPYAVGQTIEAKYFSDWVRGRITAIRPGPRGLDYDVMLVNGKRGIVPADMIRPVAAR